jgi:hypothetical protein
VNYPLEFENDILYYINEEGEHIQLHDYEEGIPICGE